MEFEGEIFPTMIPSSVHERSGTREESLVPSPVQERSLLYRSCTASTGTSMTCRSCKVSLQS